MQFHYYTLRHLADWLNTHLAGQGIEKCLSQNRNELVLGFASYSLRIGCHTPLSYIVPVEAFSEARKNVVGLFPEIMGLQFLDSRVVPYERILILRLEQDWELVLKMHGAGANVLLRHQGEIKHLFRQNLEQDWAFAEMAGPYDPNQLPTEIPSDASSLGYHLRQVSPIFNKPFVRRMQALMATGLKPKDAFVQMEAEAQNLRFYLQRTAHNIDFSLFSLQPGPDEVCIEGIAKALMVFLRSHFQYQAYRQQYQAMEKGLQKPLEKYRKILESYRTQIHRLKTERNPEEFGHLLMANLHQISRGQERVSLSDFYSGEAVEIKLDPRLSPQENAQRYYAKHKKRKGKLKHLGQQLEDVARKYEEAREAMTAFQTLIPPQELSFTAEGFDAAASKALKQVSRGYQREQNQAEKQRYPFRTFERGGYQIFVGRSARNNDELSFHFANKDDLWLHAKDVTGSHVIIRQRAGQSIPAPVLEYAAQLAAYYSKRKNDSLVPVQYTPRKYIRKRKGDPPGLVAVDREEVIMVEPIRP